MRTEAVRRCGAKVTQRSRPNLVNMARSPLTLAALAASAVPGLDIVHVRHHTSHTTGDFDTSVVTDRNGRQLIIRVPTSQTAQTEQSAELLALHAMSPGVRSRLPFDMPVVVGQSPVESTRGVVYEFLDGHHVPVQQLSAGTGVVSSIGRAIASIHSLPTTVVNEADLPQSSAMECRTTSNELIGRAADTGHLPTALLRRWEEALNDDELWQFPSVVINGSLRCDSFLITSESVSGVLGWSALCIGDPATDLCWLRTVDTEPLNAVLATYLRARKGGTDQQIARRAMFYGELELVRWLMYGKDTHQQSVVDDAIAMLDVLVDSVLNNAMNPLSPPTGPILAVSEVEAMLQKTPQFLPKHDAVHLQTDSYDRAEFNDEAYSRGDVIPNLNMVKEDDQPDRKKVNR
jgi:macrolide phosphotransferase